MPGIVPKNNSSRQSGAITGGTMRVGNSKSGGSANRMVSHCKSNSENPSDCVATVLNSVKPTPPTPQIVENIPKNDLFNRKSFYQYFNRLDGKAYTGTETSPPFPYAKLPSRYIEALNSAANRWARFLKVSDNTITYMKQVEDPVKYANWDGIELKEFLQIFDTNKLKGTKDENTTYASAGSFRIPPTSVITGFYMEVVVDNEVELNRTDLSTVFTHELGHALGFSNIVIANEKGEEILPLIQIDRRIIPNPKVLHDGIIRPDRTISITWNHHVSAYYDYGGWGTPYDKNISKNDKDVSNTKLLVTGTRKMPAAKNFKDLNDIGHLSSEPLYTLNYYAPLTDPPDVRYHNLGFYNEVMVPTFSPTISRYYISKVSLGRLLDLRTDIGDQTFYTYEEINPGASEVLWWRRSSDDQLVFSGLIFRDMEKEFNPDGDNQKPSFNNRVINCSCCSRVRDVV